jgi:hypothetical protein
MYGVVFLVKITHIIILSFIVIGAVNLIQFTQYESDMPKYDISFNVDDNGRLEIVNGSYADITKMSIRGCNGNLIEIDDKDEINALINCISGFSYTENSSLDGRRGWEYVIYFYDGSHLISWISIKNYSNKYHAKIDGIHYTPNESGLGTCLSDRYYDELYGSEGNYTEEDN